MYFLKEKKECCGCSACLNICPKNCISMKEDNEGFNYPYIYDSGKCINCNLCKKICPIKNGKQKSVIPAVYAVKNRDEIKRYNSSSGGAFTEIAEDVLNENGVVVGAMFDENFNVYHGMIDNIDNLYKLRGSKYVQSDLKNIFLKVKQHLNNNIKVLFSGTPCQIAGLRTYLQKEYNNLLTIDVACHGVPSPMVFNKYKKYLEIKYNSNIENLTFRSKEEGWTNYKIKVNFENGQVFSDYGYENSYMKGFISNLYIRPSCTDCKFKSFSSGSDITLADYWGVDTRYKEFNDNKGISLVFINSKKGEKVFSSVKDKFEIKETDFQHGIKYNSCIVKSVELNKKSKYFYRKVDCKEFDELIKKCIKKRKETKIEYYCRAITNVIKGKFGVRIE